MVGLVVFYEDNNVNLQSGREIDLTMWRESMKAWGFDTLIVIDVYGLNPIIGDLEINYEVYATLHKAIARHTDIHKVYIECEDSLGNLESTALEDFYHPEDAIYIIGSDAVGMDIDYIQSNLIDDSTHFVYLNTPGACVSWGLPIAGAIMYDRNRKE